MSTQPSKLHPSGVGKCVNRVSAYWLGLRRLRRGAFTCVGWQVTLYDDPIWQVTPRSLRTSSRPGLYSALNFNFNCLNSEHWTVAVGIDSNVQPHRAVSALQQHGFPVEYLCTTNLAIATDWHWTICSVTPTTRWRQRFQGTRRRQGVANLR